MTDLPPYQVARGPSGIWHVRFEWPRTDGRGVLDVSYSLAPGCSVLMSFKRGGVFWCDPDREHAATIVPLILADAWDSGRLNPEISS